jgi:hypothetical protein
MTVWIVFESGGFYSREYYARAVFSTEDKAIAYIAGKEAPMTAEKWVVDEEEES